MISRASNQFRTVSRMASTLFPLISCWAFSSISCRCDGLRSGRGARRMVCEIDWLNGA